MVIFWARRANSKIDFGAESYRDTFRFENRFLDRKSAIIGDRSSWLHAKCGLDIFDDTPVGAEVKAQNSRPFRLKSKRATVGKSAIRVVGSRAQMSL